MYFKIFSILVLTFSSNLVLAQNTASQPTEAQLAPAISEEEMAAIHVLAQICPKLVNDQQQWQQGYANILRDYLPGLKQPAAALQQLSQQPQFQPILRQAEETAQHEGDRKNRVICEEIMSYV